MKNIPTQKENPKGLHQRYYIQKIIPIIGTMNNLRSKEYKLKQIDKNAEYFVLRVDLNGGDPKHIVACRKAVMLYANEIRDHLPELSKDLIDRYGID